ncbi:MULTISPECIES: DUF4913 domain-containing protein [Actinomycetes]|uniref:DUF4913 domain-containing protein n=1 Tax=Actinomycetes TaxID=1760 RepID=UPI0010A8B478|nr:MULTISPECIES: DUF4913 domain-containing protein [Actinomycetes]
MDAIERDDDDIEVVETTYANVAEFVEQFLLPTYRRNPAKHRWDPRWWEYQEVAMRLEALWRSFEYLRLEGPTGMAVFFRDYLDPTMRELTSENGPFWRLDKLGDERTVPDAWPSTPAPRGMF